VGFVVIVLVGCVIKSGDFISFEASINNLSSPAVSIVGPSQSWWVTLLCPIGINLRHKTTKKNQGKNFVFFVVINQFVCILID
jgi:hypothetical protein